MAKKSTKSSKPKPSWGWVKTNEPGKPTDTEKTKVTALFDPYVQQLNAAIPPIEEPQRYNQVVQVTSKWYRSYFYLISHYKCPPPPIAIQDGFEVGFARLTYKAPEVYDVSYFRHTGQWFTIFYDMSLGDCFEMIKSDPIFDV